MKNERTKQNKGNLYFGIAVKYLSSLSFDCNHNNFKFYFVEFTFFLVECVNSFAKMKKYRQKAEKSFMLIVLIL